MSTAILIPARLKSSRFPDKMLVDIGGKPLIKRVYDICASTGLETWVLTDSKKISSIVPSKMTPEFCQNGTSRCAWLVNNYDFDFEQFINVQGDMPDINIEIINAVKENLSNANITTAYTEMNQEQRLNPNAVKIIHNTTTARWFGRGITGYGDHHLGIYGYKKSALLSYDRLKIFPEENIEKLEQLRWLQNGYQINVTKVNFTGIEINSPEDLKLWNSIHKK